VRRTLGSLLVVVAGLLLALSRWLDPGAGGRAPHQVPPGVERPGPPATASHTSDAQAGVLALTGDTERDAQIARVVAAMDQTGQPPDGVA